LSNNLKANGIFDLLKTVVNTVQGNIISCLNKIRLSML